ERQRDRYALTMRLVLWMRLAGEWQDEREPGAEEDTRARLTDDVVSCQRANAAQARAPTAVTGSS
ncbi:MAG TPA: hypothetical protein VK494_02890, partial [Gemmatimonadaceae bacterium]|nr:hypothetical protein [Gemmatimonadaceae bacterium]